MSLPLKENAEVERNGGSNLGVQFIKLALEPLNGAVKTTSDDANANGFLTRCQYKLRWGAAKTVKNAAPS